MPRSHKPIDATEEPRIAARLTTFLSAEKALSRPAIWHVDGRNIRFDATLEVDEITIQEIVFFGRASLQLRDRHVTLGFTWNDVRGRGGNVDRIDWRPLDPHNNKGLGPEEHRFVLIEGTHHYSIAENASTPAGLFRAIKDSLPVALPVEPEPATWEEFCALAAQRWRVAEIFHLPEPPWQYDLNLPPGESRRGKGRQS